MSATVSLCENCQRQSFKAFIGLTIRAKMVRGGHPVLLENSVETDPLPLKTPISNQYWVMRLSRNT